MADVMAQEVQMDPGVEMDHEVEMEQEVEMEEEECTFSGDSDYSDDSDFVDDVSEDELLGDLLKQKPAEPSDVNAKAIVVDGIPKVGPERLPKLSNLLHNIFGKFGTVVSSGIPKDADGKTLGYAFFDFSDANAALEAVKDKDGFKLDKAHKFRVNVVSDFTKYANVDENMEIPKKEPFNYLGNLLSFLEDENCNDQFCSMFDEGMMTGIYGNSQPEPTVIAERQRWTERNVRWSPLGAYFATVHTKGIALWGGSEFKRIQRFNHPGVIFIDFSPCEKYLVTLSQGDTPAVIIWEILNGMKKRVFTIDMSQEENLRWPIFKWSHDGKYFARGLKGVIQVYETPTMTLLDKKSISIPNISHFCWSPKSNLLAYWVAEQDQIPARVVILNIPSRTELRVKILFNVQDIRLHWHNEGRFLCVKVDRYNKTKKIHYSTFEIFHINEKQVPVDIVELKEQVQAFAWEPTGNKFCCLHGIPGYTSASFYEIKNLKVELLSTLERKSASHLFWSPAGQFIVLASVEGNNPPGTLEFVDTGDMSVMHIGEHIGAGCVEWDPTGRYVVSTANYWVQKEDAAAWFWTFQGKLLRKFTRDKLILIQWRPKPPTLLSPEQVKKIKKDHKKYSKGFEAKDRLLHSRVSKEILDKRRELMDSYTEYRQKCSAQYQQDTPYRRELRNDVNTDEIECGVIDDEWTEVKVESLFSEENEVIADDKKGKE